MISKNKKKIILSVALLSIAMILANILPAGIISFVPLEVKDLSSDTIDEGISHSPDTDEEVETVRTEGIIESPIHIDDTAENNWEWARTQAWCSGAGTESDPYIIQDLIIDGGGSGSCILIENSDAYFRIERCTLYNSGSESHDAGITLIYTNNGKIINNNCSLNQNGIMLWLYCNDNTISGNTANGNYGVGVHLRGWCTGNTISGNTASDNTKDGICIISSGHNNTISGNTANDNKEYGIHLYSVCADNNISGNTANYNTLTGIYLYTICYDNTISENTANYNDMHGIFLMYDGFDNTISENTANNNIQYGIYLRGQCTGNTISENTVNDNDYGIYLRATPNSNTISGNTVNDNDYGIYLMDRCIGNTISGNTVNDNDYGIYLIDSCRFNTISGNLIKDNQKYGIYINSCNFNQIYQNSLIGTVESHAYDSGVNNKWNSSVIGNYWDNHMSPDSDNDGIVDTPYTWIVGSAGSEDDLPLVESPIHVGDRIHIDDDGNCAPNWNRTAELNLWCSGFGTPNDPYVIKDLTINADGSGSGILIENSNAYFGIENCTVYNSGSGTFDAGIKLDNTNNGSIMNNDCSNNIRYGIFLFNNCENNTIGRNTVNDNYHGIYLRENCNNNTIFENIANDNNWYGICLYNDCGNNTIWGNTANDNNAGIYLRKSDDNDIIGGNTANNNDNGIRLDYLCDGNTISGNTANNNYYGILLFKSDDNTMSGNILINNNHSGIFLWTDCNHNIISGNTIDSSGFGITLQYSSENTFSGNTVNSNGFGIYLYVSDDNNANKNKFFNNLIGIGILGSSSNNIFYLNKFYSSEYCHVRYSYPYSDSGNSWDNGAIGNYWDDYTGIDYDDNLIGDTPYDISIPLSEADNYPIWDDGPYGGTIHIDDDNDENNWADASSRYWCSGSGEEWDPYVIKDLIIDGGGSALGSCITIKNSDAYFRIENCTLYRSGFGGLDAGIRLINTNNGEIINNDVSQNLYGIWLKNSNYNRIENNLLSENFVGIILTHSSENLVIGNTFSDNQGAISIAGSSSYNTIYLNLFYRSSVHACFLDYSGSENSWYNSGLGNHWDDYTGRDNNDDGIGDWAYTKNGVFDRYPLYEDGPIHIDEFGGGDYTWEEASARYWCSGSGTEQDPYVIKDLIIDDDGDLGVGILIINSNAHFRIENCRVYNSGSGTFDAGIKLYNTTNGEIIKNDCSENYNGIILILSDDNIISGNTANYNTQHGIYIYYTSDSNTISGNTANYNTEYGIYIHDHSDFNNISGNIANNNTYGIYLDGTEYPSKTCEGNMILRNTVNNNTEDGICITRNQKSTIIFGNNANYNGNNGILLDHTIMNHVADNIASNNGNYGIEVEYSWLNSGTGNYLPNNRNGPFYQEPVPLFEIEYTY